MALTPRETVHISSLTTLIKEAEAKIAAWTAEIEALAAKGLVVVEAEVKKIEEVVVAEVEKVVDKVETVAGRKPKAEDEPTK